MRLALYMIETAQINVRALVMKIIHVISEFASGGAEAVAINLAISQRSSYRERPGFFWCI